MMAVTNRKKTITRKMRNVVLLALAGAGLGACSSNLAGLSSGAPSLAPTTDPVVSRPAAIVPSPPALARPAKTVTLAMAPIVGPPAGISKKLTAKISSELQKRNIRVINGKGAYKMRGYVVSSSEGKGAKLAYLWDLDNKAGKRQTRISGEKTVSGGDGKDPWKGVNDSIIAAIAGDTAGQLADWMVKKKGGTAAGIASRTAALPARSRRSAKAPGSAGNATRRVIMAMVVPVTGAPGDGKISLTRAIRTRLYKKGIRLTSKRTDSVYQVRGVVQMGKASSGKQPIRIDWRVYDPRGKRLGTVTQKNEIPQGSLNGSWGGVADAAAGAAANGIAKLLPKTTRRL